MLLKNYAKTGQRKDFESIFYRALRRAAKKSEKNFQTANFRGEHGGRLRIPDAILRPLHSRREQRYKIFRRFQRGAFAVVQELL